MLDKKERIEKGIDPSTPKMSPTKWLIHLKNQKTPPWHSRDLGPGEKTFADKLQSSEKFSYHG